MSSPLKASMFLDEDSDLTTVIIRRKVLHFVKPERLSTMCKLPRYRGDRWGNEIDWTVVDKEDREEYNCCRQCVDKFTSEEFNEPESGWA